MTSTRDSTAACPDRSVCRSERDAQTATPLEADLTVEKADGRRVWMVSRQPAMNTSVLARLQVPGSTPGQHFSRDFDRQTRRTGRQGSVVRGSPRFVVARGVEPQELGPASHHGNVRSGSRSRAVPREPHRLQADRERADDVLIERIADEPGLRGRSAAQARREARRRSRSGPRPRRLSGC